MHTSIVRVTYLRQIAAAALDLGVDVKSLLSESGLLEGNLVDPTVEIPIEKFGAFITAAIACSGATGLGVLAGRRMPPSSHGLVGLAAMTSRNIREAMQIIERFVGLRTGVIDIHTRVVDGMLEVYFAPAPGLGAASNPVHVKQLVASSSSHWLRNAARQGSVLHLRSFRVEGDGFDE